MLFLGAPAPRCCQSGLHQDGIRAKHARRSAHNVAARLLETTVQLPAKWFVGPRHGIQAPFSRASLMLFVNRRAPCQPFGLSLIPFPGPPTGAGRAMTAGPSARRTPSGPAEHGRPALSRGHAELPPRPQRDEPNHAGSARSATRRDPASSLGVPKPLPAAFIFRKSRPSSLVA